MMLTANRFLEMMLTAKRFQEHNLIFSQYIIPIASG